MNINFLCLRQRNTAYSLPVGKHVYRDSISPEMTLLRWIDCVHFTDAAFVGGNFGNDAR